MCHVGNSFFCVENMLETCFLCRVCGSNVIIVGLYAPFWNVWLCGAPGAVRGMHQPQLVCVCGYCCPMLNLVVCRTWLED